MKKTILAERLIIFFLVSIAAFSLATIVHAQVVESGAPPTGGLCPVPDIQVPNTDLTNNLNYLRVPPDGSGGFISGSYNIVVPSNCGGDQDACSAVSTAVSGAILQSNSISGFPTATFGYGSGFGNPNQIIVRTYNDPSGGGPCNNDGAMACEIDSSGNVQTYNAFGQQFDIVQIWINLGEQTGGLFSNTVASQCEVDPNFCLSLIEHEVTHAFGFADINSKKNAAGNLMNFQMLNTTNPPTWLTDTQLQTAIVAVNSLASQRQYDMTNWPSDCSVSCGEGQVAEPDPNSPNGTTCVAAPTSTPLDSLSCLSIGLDTNGNATKCLMQGGVWADCSTVPPTCYDSPDRSHIVQCPDAAATTCSVSDPNTPPTDDNSTSTVEQTDSSDPFDSTDNTIDGTNVLGGLDDYLSNSNGDDPASTYGGDDTWLLDGSPGDWNMEPYWLDGGDGGGDGGGGGQCNEWSGYCDYPD